ncbi:hypothetical protein D3C73_1438690 [compost metagenome]
MLGRVQRVVDAQQAALGDSAQQPFHARQHPFRPGFVKELAKAWVLTALGHDQAAQLDRLITADQRLEAPGNVQQHLFDGRALGVLEHQVG